VESEGEGRTGQVTDEALFYERFLADIRRCAPGRQAAVSTLRRRVRVALGAAPPERDRRWAVVVRAIDELLRVADRESGPARRLRAFVSENADLGWARDLAITELAPTLRPVGVLGGPRGRYLVLAAPSR
jgi:hypothetical protein